MLTRNLLIARQDGLLHFCCLPVAIFLLEPFFLHLLLQLFGIGTKDQASPTATSRSATQGGLGWTMGLEPTTTGITTRGSTN